MLALSARCCRATARAVHVGPEETYAHITASALVRMARLFSEPMAGLGAIRNTAESQHRHSIELSWGDLLCQAVSLAATGQAARTLPAVLDAQHRLERTGNDDGLPDLLLVPATLAWSIGELDRAAAWVIAIWRLARTCT